MTGSFSTFDRRAAVVLAAHGAPATDYPTAKVGLLMALDFAGGKAARTGFLRSRKEKLEEEIRTWPRTSANDPYKSAVDELAGALSASTGLKVFPAYNEFCTPTIRQAIDQAVAEGADPVIVIPTMLLRGNQHTEEEILEAVEDARQRHPEVRFHYAWPFPQESLVSLFVGQIFHFLK